MSLNNPITRLLDLIERAHSSLTGIGPDDHHNRSHDHSSADDGSPIAVAGVPSLPASKITSERFTMPRMPDGTSGYVLTAQGAGVDPAFSELSGNAILEKFQKHLGVWWFNANWAPSGFISNGASGSDSLTWREGELELHTGTTSGSYAYCEKTCLGLSGVHSWTKKRYFSVRVEISAITAQNIHLVSGYYPQTGSANNLHHIGFKVVNDSIYGTVADGTTESTLLLETLTGGVTRRLEVIFTPASEARFYLDGVDKGAITTNLPSGAAYSEIMLGASAHNTENAEKSACIFESRTFQEE